MEFIWGNQVTYKITGASMGQALIGCCYWATANQSSPLSGLILSVGFHYALQKMQEGEKISYIVSNKFPHSF